MIEALLSGEVNAEALDRAASQRRNMRSAFDNIDGNGLIHDDYQEDMHGNGGDADA